VPPIPRHLPSLPRILHPYPIDRFLARRKVTAIPEAYLQALLQFVLIPKLPAENNPLISQTSLKK